MNGCRIGAVSYLNTKPLVYDLARLAPHCTLVFDLPSRLADQLADGKLDAALIPSIEAIRHPEYTIVSDACIACHGPVWSVKLLSHIPLTDIQRVALDEGSRTSVVLVEIMLQKQFGIRPRFTTLKLDDTWETKQADAVLVIGDRAMRAETAAFPVQVDLGDWWTQWTQLPFVFAMWAARPEANLSYLDQVLTTCRDQGLKHLESIAKVEAPKHQLTPEQCVKYLSHNLHFSLGEAEKAGLDLYFRHGAELGTVPDDMRLQFHDCQTT